MKSLESYHILCFIIAYMSIYQTIPVQAPELKIPRNIYVCIALAPILWLASSTDSSALEQLALVCSYGFFIRACSTMIHLAKDTKTNVSFESYAHMVTIISILMMIYNKNINVYSAYIMMITFSIMSLCSQKTTIQFCVEDYVLMHLLFFFTK